MAVWMKNLANALEDKPVIILHGNVRDRYIDDQGRVCHNLTDLVQQMVGDMKSVVFSERIVYDSVGMERRFSGETRGQSFSRSGSDELADTQAQQRGQHMPPSRVLAIWQEQVALSAPGRMFILYYLDKLVAYKNSYQEDEKEILLRLEKIIENIQPNHRLLMVALQDTMIPLELYTHAPKVRVLPVPLPEKADRLAYFRHCLGKDYSYLEPAADLTDGLFLHDLDALNTRNALAGAASSREVRDIVNRYRIGEQTDHWSALDIEKLSGALTWFNTEEGIIGQDQAIGKVIDMLTIARAGLSGMASGAGAKPRGVLFFAGPSGVGKTFAAKKLAKFLFSTEEAFFRFDMSEFKEEHTVSKLLGSPPGYIGSERGGMLTNAVREKPFSVLLFDEIEKADTRILDIFLQMTDDGRLTDSRGQTVFFSETVIIFTSNIGTRTNDSRGKPIPERDQLDQILAGTDESSRPEAVRRHFIRCVQHFFMYEISRPELLNRFGDSIVPFNYIHSTEVQKRIMEAHLKRICTEFAEKYRHQGHTLTIASGSWDWLVEKYGEKISEMGGRGMTNIIRDEIMLPLARAVLRAEHEERKNMAFVLERDEEKIRVRR